MAVLFEPELLMSRRPFPESQELLRGVPLSRLPGRVDVGWHSNDVHPETGACAVIGLDQDPELRGEVLKITFGSRECFVWVIAQRPLPVPVSITRRAMFPTLAGLWHDSIRCVVEVVA